MKTKLFLSIVFLFLLITGCSQTKESRSKLNLSFEDIQNGKPQGWLIYQKQVYRISLDSIHVKSGKYSILIESTGDPGLRDFQPVTLLLPDNYDGKNITLSGYIKTEDVTDGYAGLWMRIDPQINPQKAPIAFDNMYQRGITGTTDWKKYEITLSMNPTKTKEIVLGGMLAGKGKMWLDDLHISIDGKDISEAKVIEKALYPAEKDKAFDNGSDITFPALNKQQINNLELPGRIWGLLKYHHPEIATGNYNWDYELFRMLPEYLKITDNAKRDDYLIYWIEKYDKGLEIKTNQDISVDAFLKLDLSWVDKSDMTQKLKEKLKTIYQNRNQGEQYYIRIVNNANGGYPVFTNENQYQNMPCPDAGFRLLALYRFWNIINYFYPYKYLTDKNWNDVLKDYIPKFISAETQLEYDLATSKLIGELDDSNAGLGGGIEKIDTLRGNRVAPFQVKFVENQLVVTKYHIPESQEKTGLKMGDIITHINGKPIKAIADSVKEYYSASNATAQMRNIANDLLRSSDQTIRINYISSNQSQQKDLQLYDREDVFQNINKGDTMLSYKLLNDNIGYINMKAIREKHIENIKADFKNTKGIIIDFRNRPPYYYNSIPFASYFVSSNTLFAKFTQGNTNNPGEFTYTYPVEISKQGETYQGKLIVLVNEETQSQAEYLSMAFRAGNNTKIVGSQTAGAAGGVSYLYLPGGLKVGISDKGIYYPNGKQTQRIGIVPDIVVKPTIKGIREGRDEVLEKAIEIIKSDKRQVTNEMK